MLASRRQFLVHAASMAAAGILAGCVRHAPQPLLHPLINPALPESACSLPPVHVAAEREIRTVVGLRPFRPSGFVVKPEKFGDTLVIHNYGHGGGGVTLSWGTARLAVDLGAPGYTGSVAVLGSGAVGLATARLVQEAGLAVTIYTKALPPNTTSNIAGAQWFPVTVSDPDRRTPEFNRQFLAAAQYAYTRYQIMIGPHYGIRWMRNYYLSSEPWIETGYSGQESPLRAMMPEFRDLKPQEYPFSGYAHVRQFDTMIVEPPVYLPAMLDEVRRAGGVIRVQEIHDITALRQLPEKLVFNCTGLGARDLFHDEELQPIRGQLTFLLPQPEVQYATIFDGLYMFSRSDGIVLGGSHDLGNWSLDPDATQKASILANHQRFFSSFRSC
jgi:glycine/D-amino acid oxidase-like deaminating enzyme